MTTPLDHHRCGHCKATLLRCPLGDRCKGSDPLDPATCQHCSWGLICSTHARRWTRT